MLLWYLVKDQITIEIKHAVCLVSHLCVWIPCFIFWCRMDKNLSYLFLDKESNFTHKAYTQSHKILFFVQTKNVLSLLYFSILCSPIVSIYTMNVLLLKVQAPQLLYCNLYSWEIGQIRRKPIQTLFYYCHYWTKNVYGKYRKVRYKWPFLSCFSSYVL